MDSMLLISFTKIIVASVLGACIGAERTIAGKNAGMRTFSLVAMGSALFIVIALYVNESFVGIVNFDPMRVAAGVITGVGFIGAGIIFSHDDTTHGLTSAAGLWAASGVGMAVGYGLFPLAVFSTILVLFIFTGLWFVEERVREAINASSKSPLIQTTSPQQGVSPMMHTPIPIQNAVSKKIASENEQSIAVKNSVRRKSTQQVATIANP